MRGVLGALGSLAFVCSDKLVVTHKDMSREIAARWAKHEVIGKKPKLEFVGPDLYTVSLKVRFDLNLGMPPAAGFLKLRKMLENKLFKTLIVGGEYMGRYVIDSISEERKYHNGAGICIIGEATINLTEWSGS
jgi:phage protein U